MSVCFAQGLTISNQAHRPEGLVRNILPKPISVIAAVVSGIIKTLLFPLTAILLTVGFTGKAIYECAKGRNGGKYAAAALLNFAGIVAVIGFLGASAFCLPFSFACAIVLTAVTVSIVFHVIKTVEGK